MTVTPSETVAPVAPTTVETAPVAESPATTTEAAPAAPTTVTKEGDTINVENPNVEVNFPNGNGKYSPLEVEYKDIHIPDDAPKVDIPEFNAGIPGIPEVRELPEYNEPIGTVPNEAPKYEKPEFQGGIPGIPEERELPPFDGGLIPNDAPILDLPELHIPVEPEKPAEPTPNKPQKPSTPKEVPNKPVDAPKNKEVEITTVSYKIDSEPSEVANTPVYGCTLPHTGEKEGIMSTLGLVVIAAGITALTLGFKKYNEGEEK